MGKNKGGNFFVFFSQVKVLYVRNLTQLTTEEMLKEKFDEFGKVERVKKIKDYAFVHFEERDEACKVSQLGSVVPTIIICM